MLILFLLGAFLCFALFCNISENHGESTGMAVLFILAIILAIAIPGLGLIMLLFIAVVALMNWAYKK